jgi:hypothetical protein
MVGPVIRRVHNPYQFGRQQSLNVDLLIMWAAITSGGQWWTERPNGDWFPWNNVFDRLTGPSSTTTIFTRECPMVLTAPVEIIPGRGATGTLTGMMLDLEYGVQHGQEWVVTERRKLNLAAFPTTMEGWCSCLSRAGYVSNSVTYVPGGHGRVSKIILQSPYITTGLVATYDEWVFAGRNNRSNKQSQEVLLQIISEGTAPTGSPSFSRYTASEMLKAAVIKSQTVLRTTATTEGKHSSETIPKEMARVGATVRANTDLSNFISENYPDLLTNATNIAAATRMAGLTLQVALNSQVNSFFSRVSFRAVPELRGFCRFSEFPSPVVASTTEKSYTASASSAIAYLLTGTSSDPVVVQFLTLYNSSIFALKNPDVLRGVVNVSRLVKELGPAEAKFKLLLGLLRSEVNKLGKLILNYTTDTPQQAIVVPDSEMKREDVAEAVQCLNGQMAITDGARKVFSWAGVPLPTTST